MTGPGALPGAKKNEWPNYSGCVLTAEAEWPVKLQMREGQLAVITYVCVCRLKRMALPQAHPTMLCIH